MMNSIGFRTTGFDGRPVVVKFLGLKTKSSNQKTGPAIQSYLLPEGWMLQKRIGDDYSVCSTCPHSFGEKDDCYVHHGSSKMGLISTMKAMPDVMLDDTDLLISKYLDIFAGRYVRFGSYGEPVLMGQTVVEAIAHVSSHWTGYTHRWKEPEYQWAKQFFMASTDNQEEMELATSMGWRSFRIMEEGESALKSEVLCPASKEAGRIATCDKCKLCKGASSKAKSVAIFKH